VQGTVPSGIYKDVTILQHSFFHGRLFAPERENLI
jgi:hypothetical protein